MASLTLTNEHNTDYSVSFTIDFTQVVNRLHQLKSIGAEWVDDVKSFIGAMAHHNYDAFNTRPGSWDNAARDRAEMAAGVYRSMR